MTGLVHPLHSCLGVGGGQGETRPTSRCLPLLQNDAVIISGRKLAQQIRQEARHEVEQWVAAGNKRPHLSVVLVGENPASHSYVLNKTKAAADVGRFLHSCLCALTNRTLNNEYLELI
uniref:Tetrahydrofolate dehydrogenase/cyclohydrolase catalytic domain-containing protein n=1 Tax=Gopherus agassizii TaxID=38772 RepID=A0A452J7M4_9SAUR